MSQIIRKIAEIRIDLATYCLPTRLTTSKYISLYPNVTSNKVTL